MKSNLIPLKTWIECNCNHSGTIKQKDEAAFLLDVGIATIYRWLKAGNVFIEETGVDISGEGGPLYVWKMEKVVEA